MSVDDLKRNIDKRIQDGIKSSQITTADFGFIDTKINSLKAAIDMLSDKRVENEMKIASLEQRLANVHAESGGPLDDKMLNELRTMKREVEGAKLRMDSVERVVQDTARTAHEAESAARRFEGFERLSGLQHDVDDKLRQFVAVQDELGKLSNRTEAMYEGVEKRFAELRTAEREMEDAKREAADTRKELEIIRAASMRAASKQELADVAADVRMARDLEGKMEDLETHVRKIDMAYSRSATQSGVSSEVLTILKEMDDRMGNVERTIAESQGGAAPAPGMMGAQDVDARMADIVDKLVYLESRLSALEAVFQTSSRTQAVVIE
jgi:chromosome segregation ATPase